MSEVATADGRGFTSERHRQSIRLAAHLSSAHPEALRAMWARVIVRPNAYALLEDFRMAHGRAIHEELRTPAGRETWCALEGDDPLRGEARLHRERLGRLANVGYQARKIAADPMKSMDPRRLLPR